MADGGVLVGITENSNSFSDSVAVMNVLMGDHGVSSTFTVRKMSAGIGVERIFPLHSPVVDSIEVMREGRVRQSRIYYLRNLRGKAARIKSRNVYGAKA